MKHNELTYKDLKKICNPDIFEFETTDDLDSVGLVYGQERAVSALQFGINIHSKGYNIYVEGPAGVGKTMYTNQYVSEVAGKQKTPDDWCYIYNFDNPNEPIAVSLPAGEGKVFVQTMDSFILDIKRYLKKTFNNEDFEKEKGLIKQKFEEKRTNLLDKLNKDTLKYNFSVKSAPNGIYMLPVYNGKTIDEEEFEKLDDAIKKDYEDKSNVVQDLIMQVIGKVKLIEKEAEQKVDEWQSNIALLTINSYINPIRAIYKKNSKIIKFLDNVKADILKNINLFIAEEPKTPSVAPQTSKPESISPWLNYRVNLFVDNSNTSGAPVIIDSNYSYHDLFGKLEYENQFGMLRTDYTMLKCGSLHKANGGYIILQAQDLLTTPVCYDTLKKALLNGASNIENNMEQRSAMVMIALKPEPIPLDLKVILIGDSNIYHTLLSLDPDFRKLFKIKVEFEESAPRNDDNMLKLAKFVHSYSEREGSLPLDKAAMAKIVEFASRISEDKEKLSTHFNEIGEVVSEASTWAKLARKKVVTVDYVEKALTKRIERVKKYDQQYSDLIDEKSLLIDTSGYKVGEINGLTVMSIGDYTFGKPAKITANTFMGKTGVVNVEREVDMSGATHSKGILILRGYLGEKFAQDFPLSLTASICFEQLYNGVDGDSASSTECYAILSSLSNIPINQSFAVTGSVNQKGFIQPIGGVNEKIEGFYSVCKKRGLTGSQGVIIPIQNVRNLHLSNEIIESVRQGKFHIYAISTIDEGIEILTGVPAGKQNKDGKFPAGTINYLVYEKLKKYYENSKKVAE